MYSMTGNNQNMCILTSTGLFLSLNFHVKWVTVTTAWRVLSFLMD